MKRKFLLIVLFVISQATPAVSDECFRTLIQDTHVLTLDSASSFATLDLIYNELSEKDQEKVNIDVTGYGAASKDRFRHRLQEFYRQTGIRWDSKTKIALKSQTLSSDSVEAYRNCKDGELKSGPRAIAYDATPGEVTVKVTWLSPPKAPTKSKATWQISNGILPEKMKKTWRTGESDSFIVMREKGKDLRLTVTIGGQSDEIYVPYHPVVRETITYEAKKYPENRGKRMANDGTGHNQGPISDCVYAKTNQEIEPESARVNVTTRVGHLDRTSYARLRYADHKRACYEAYLRPLSKSGGGDMWFHIGYRLGTLKYEIIE